MKKLFSIGKPWDSAPYRQAGRFLVVGGISTAVNYAFFAVLYWAGTSYIAASAAGYIVGVIVGYFLNRSWTFIPATERRFVEAASYVGVYLFSLLLSLAALRIAVEAGSISPLIGNVVAIVVSTISNFFGLRFITFNSVFASRVKRIAMYCTPAFFIVLGIKIVASVLFASHVATHGFLPFVNYFRDTLHNPYQYFAFLGDKIFPYPAGMLFIIGLPSFLLQQVLSVHILGNVNLQLFLMRIPVLMADVFIYLVLCHLLPTKEKKVFWLYFASPIVFYINYFHGQLDVIPTALLLLSIVGLFRKREIPAFLVLGLGIATKTHLLAAVPFFVLYLYRNGTPAVRIMKLVGIALAAFLIVNPYLFSSGFLSLVFNNPEQARLFNLFIPFGFADLKFFLVPATLLLVFYKLASYRKLNRDALFLTLGLIYAALIALVPPMPGWFYWSLPFLVFFLVKFKNAPLISFGAMNAFYLLYFAFVRNSDIFESFSPLSRSLAGMSHPFFLLQGIGVNGATVENILFTALEASLLMVVFWVYNVGIASNAPHEGIIKPFALGIAGDSGVGKTTIAEALGRVVGERNLVRLNGDDVHKWERGHEKWRVLTHLDPKSNYVHIDLDQIRAFLRGESIERPMYDHRTGTFGAPARLEPKRFVVFDGLMPFVLEHMRTLFALKVYVEADEGVRIGWKTSRDRSERGYREDEVKQQIESRRGDAERFIHPQRPFADLVIRYTQGAGGAVGMEYLVKNSLYIEDIVEALSAEPGLAVDHRYLDLHLQRVSFSGEVSREAIERIAHQLFPDMVDFLEHYPEFDGGFRGISQLFLVGILKITNNQ